MKKTTLFALIILLSACQNSNSNQGVEPILNESTSYAQEIEEIYYSKVDNLRVRESPSMEGKIIYSLEKGQKLVYLNEKSTNKDEARILGKDVEDNWYKVRIKDDNKVVGWVFGGAIENENSTKGKQQNETKTKNVNSLTAQEVETLLKIKGIKKENAPYKGWYTYYLTLNNKEVLDGEFRIQGKTISREDSEEYSKITYEGQFSNGEKTGTFKELLFFYEGEQETLIEFSGKPNGCLWKAVKGSSEGAEFEHRYDNPNCSFIPQKIESNEEAEEEG